ncbi:hypothetical protein C8R45DRAFT_923304 [Mycena sanguinolenta]|nr:hypothetical protein C8R45DRAFT_923304 [Mycena sanguinolenta]
MACRGDGEGWSSDGRAWRETVDGVGRQREPRRETGLVDQHHDVEKSRRCVCQIPVPEVSIIESARARRRRGSNPTGRRRRKDAEKEGDEKSGTSRPPSPQMTSRCKEGGQREMRRKGAAGLVNVTFSTSSGLRPQLGARWHRIQKPARDYIRHAECRVLPAQQIAHNVDCIRAHGSRRKTRDDGGHLRTRIRTRTVHSNWILLS